MEPLANEERREKLADLGYWIARWVLEVQQIHFDASEETVEQYTFG